MQKQFPGKLGSKDYSGFDRRLWPLRNNTQHRKDVDIIKKCKHTTKAAQLESKLGVRYSELLRLPYFDPVRMLIIDPMHCLYLGITKHLMKSVWIDREILTPKQLQLLQECVNSCSAPANLGRIPHKIASNFSGFTADQFKNWTNLFSLISLVQMLPEEHMKCWRVFVMASRVLSKHVLSVDDISGGDALLLQFCRLAKSLYGKSSITPNMHMACHIKDCLLDNGPMHGFWLFSFERMNGILESQPNNNRAIEVQLMRTFLKDSFSVTICCLHCITLKNSPMHVFKQLTTLPCGSLGETLAEPNEPQNVELPKKNARYVFVEAEQFILSRLYSQINPNISSLCMNSVYQRYMSITIAGKKFSASINHKNPSIYLAKWNETLFGCCPDQDSSCSSTIVFDKLVRPIIIHYNCCTLLL